jgi:catechol 2,3-dioxygenase-like lactoylglutathione lyase family enzyme
MRYFLTAILALVYLTPHRTFSQTTEQPAPASDVVGSGNFDHIVADMDRGVHFYRDIIGLPLPGGAQPFGDKPEIMRLSNTVGGQNRIAVFRVPGSSLGVELIEYKGVERTLAHPRIQDPGAGILVLRVRDLDSVVARLKTSGATILTKGGQPVTLADAHAAFVQDPDGFFVELMQPIALAPAEPGASNILGADFSTTIIDATQTVKFYHDLLGFDLQNSGSFMRYKAFDEAAGIPGAEMREVSGQVPGSTLHISFTEFKGIDRKPLHTHVQDPGTALLQLRVRDTDAMVARLKAAGTEVISAGGEPVTRGNLRLVIVRDPNNLFIELFSPAPTNK